MREHDSLDVDSVELLSIRRSRSSFHVVEGVVDVFFWVARSRRRVASAPAQNVMAGVMRGESMFVSDEDILGFRGFFRYRYRTGTISTYIYTLALALVIYLVSITVLATVYY